MHDSLKITSHKGTYSAQFVENAFDILDQESDDKRHFIIDKKVARLYSGQLKNVLNSSLVLEIEAKESNKRLDKFTGYVEHLVSNNIRRDHTLIAIGGGVIQDIVCFLSATLLRGLPWEFYPTTLLAQADSCIGSKSSINVGNTKNILGTFTPPVKIFIDPKVLTTLEESEIKSGIGEMLKVHGIKGPEAFYSIARDYEKFFSDDEIMTKHIKNSLEIKKKYIEMDEFDKGPRNIMNYGHSFGHAIESATNFKIPHGVAVTIGMDMAGFFAFRTGVCLKNSYDLNHPILKKNYSGFESITIPPEEFFNAIAKDKKNKDDLLHLILPGKDGKVCAGLYTNDAKFKNICVDYLSKGIWE